MACSSGACVKVGYDSTAGLIRVTDSKNPDLTPIVWTPEMWTTSVLSRVLESQLPPGAVTAGVTEEQMVEGFGVVAWDGGSVLWRGRDEHGTQTEHEYDAEEWQTFVNGVEAGEYDVARLIGG